MVNSNQSIISKNKIPFLRILIDQPIKEFQIRNFRGFVNANLINPPVWFHNHGENGSYIHTYPMVQYGIGNQKPMMIFQKEAATYALDHLLIEGDLVLGRKQLPVFFNEYEEKELGVTQERYTYKLKNWVALNTDNYQIFKTLKSRGKQLLFLESILKSNIQSYLEFAGITVDVSQLQCDIIDELNRNKVRAYRVNLLSFTVLFESNVMMPSFVGIGQSTSLGFGRVLRR